MLLFATGILLVARVLPSVAPPSRKAPAHKSASMPNPAEREPATSLTNPNIKVKRTAPRFARKLMNPKSVPKESGEVAREASRRKATKLIEANQSAERARSNKNSGIGIRKRPTNMRQRIAIEPFAILRGEILKRINPPHNLPKPLIAITSAPPQANCMAVVSVQTSANKEGSQFPRLIMDP